MHKYRESCMICESGLALCEVFHNKTSLSHKTGHIFSSHISRAFDDPLFISLNADMRDFKKQKSSNSIPLEKVEVKGNLQDAILKRKSVRKFVNRKVSFEQLSTILLLSYGKNQFGNITVPSAGGNYPIKLIVIVNNVEGLDQGIYEYSHLSESLIPLYIAEDCISYENVTQSLTLCEKAAFSIHFIGSLELVCYKYQDRGYRFINIECGHVAQNLSLVCTTLGVGAICSGGYLDGEFIQYLEEKSTCDFSDFIELYEMYFGIEDNSGIH